MRSAININLAAKLEDLRDVVLDASTNEWRDEEHGPAERFPALLDWRHIKRLARSARGHVVGPTTGLRDLNGVSVEAREAGERVLEAALAMRRARHTQDSASTEIGLLRAADEFAVLALCLKHHRTRDPCRFPKLHPGVHSWDVQREAIHHATGKPARKGARR